MPLCVLTPQAGCGRHECLSHDSQPRQSGYPWRYWQPIPYCHTHTVYDLYLWRCNTPAAHAMNRSCSYLSAFDRVLAHTAENLSDSVQTGSSWITCVAIPESVPPQWFAGVSVHAWP